MSDLKATPHNLVTYADSDTFSTERLQLAIYLHASGRLAFLGCEAQSNGKIRFVFEDPDSVGTQIELEFDTGAEIAASALFASQRYLRRKMSEELNTRRIEKPNYGTSN